MSSGWTPERRAKQAKAIRQWKPWERSTGPTSNEGKAKASKNAIKEGPLQNWREMMKAMRQLLREQDDTLDG